MRSASSCWLIRMSTRQPAWPAMTSRAVPPSIVPMLIVVPAAGSAVSTNRLMISARAWTALAPAAGSLPAWASMPEVVMAKVPMS